MMLSAPDWDVAMCDAASTAAGAIATSGKTGHSIDRDLEDALDAALGVPGHRIVRREKIPYDYPGWCPQPGPLDLGIYDGGHVVVACELKLHDIDWGRSRSLPPT